MKRATTGIAIAMAMWTTGASAQALEDVEIVTTHIAGNVYMLEGRGGNIAVSVGDDGILIVDDQFAPLADKIKAAIAAIQPGSVAYVLNTHHHGDHTGGNAIFSKDATIIAQHGVRERLSASSHHDPNSLPIITFGQTLMIYFNGEAIRMVHFPHGHTDNDSVIFFPQSNVVHMGDLLFTGSFPSFYTNQGGDIRGYAKNVGDIIPMIPGGAKIIAGHGPLATIDDVKAFHQMLVKSIEIVRGRIDEGMSVEEARAAGLPQEIARYANEYTSVETWIGRIYQNLSQ